MLPTHALRTVSSVEAVHYNLVFSVLAISSGILSLIMIKKTFWAVKYQTQDRFIDLLVSIFLVFCAELYFALSSVPFSSPATFCSARFTMTVVHRFSSCVEPAGSMRQIFSQYNLYTSVVSP